MCDHLSSGASAAGVDVVLDCVGGSQFKDAMKCVKWGAHIMPIGFASGSIPTVRMLWPNALCPLMPPQALQCVSSIPSGIHHLYGIYYLLHMPKVEFALGPAESTAKAQNLGKSWSM